MSKGHCRHCDKDYELKSSLITRNCPDCIRSGHSFVGPCKRCKDDNDDISPDKRNRSRVTIHEPEWPEAA
jgi:hypothetical protein